MVKLDFQKPDIAKKNFEFAKEITKLYGDEKGKEEIVNLLETHIYPTTDGRSYLSIDSVHEVIVRKAWLMYQENENAALNFLELPILEQLRKIKAEQELDQKIFKSIKNEVSPWLSKFFSLNKQIPSPFDEKWIVSDRRSLQNIYNYNLLIQKSKKLDLSEIDKGMIILNYYLMLIEGPFEDKIDFIFALIFLVDGKLSIPNKSGDKSKKITKLSDILDDDFTLGWKKDGLKHYKMPYLSQCLDNKLRNQIAHLKYEINDRGQIFLEDGTELKLKDLFNKQTELMHVIHSLGQILFLEPQLNAIRSAIEEILKKICETVKKGINPWNS